MAPQDRPPEDLPPTLEILGVSPLWRLLALAALIGVLLLGGLAGVLLLALAGTDRAGVVPPAPPAVAILPAPPPALPPGFPGDDDEEAVPGVPPPFPLVQDLAPAGVAEANEAKAVPAAPPRHREILGLARSLWVFTNPAPPGRTLVSPNGTSLAAEVPDALLAGPLSNPSLLTEDGLGPFVLGPGGGPGGAGVAPGMGWPGLPPLPPGPAGGGSLSRVLGGWSSAGDHLFWCGPGGQVHGFRFPLNMITVLPRHSPASAVAPTPDGTSLLVVRRRHGAKADLPGRPAGTDPVEVVLCRTDDAAVAPRTLVPAGESDWLCPAVSPDGKQVALLGNRPDAGPAPGAAATAERPWRVFVVDLAGGAPRAVAGPAAPDEGLCWTPDGRGLLFVRRVTSLPPSRRPAPAMVLAPNPLPQPGAGDADLSGAPAVPTGLSATFPADRLLLNVVHLDLASGRETPLTPGGGFTSPSTTRDGGLCLLALTGRPDGVLVQLVRVPLDGLLARAKQWQARDEQARKNWADLGRQVLADAGAAGPGKVALDGDTARRLADAFKTRFVERFKANPPTLAGDLDARRQTLAGWSLPAEDRGPLETVLAAVEGEALRGSAAGSCWLPDGGPGRPTAGPGLAVLADNDFALAVNPLRALGAAPPAADRTDTTVPTLAAAAARARGRPILLGTDPAAARRAAAALVAPDLARARDALAGGKPEEGERLLLGLLGRHEGNGVLLVTAAGLLYEHGRTAALRDLMLRHKAALPPDPRAHNLLGLVLADTDPPAALTAFRDALRCDLRHGPAYLNLARAYAAQGDPVSARRTLRHFLKASPDSPLTGDARRRLAELADAPPGVPAAAAGG